MLRQRAFLSIMILALLQGGSVGQVIPSSSQVLSALNKGWEEVLTDTVNQRLQQARNLSSDDDGEAALSTLKLLRNEVRTFEHVSETTKDALDNKIQMEVKAILDSLENSFQFDVIRGQVLRSDGASAEISLNVSHGLYPGRTIQLFRSGVQIDSMKIIFVDQRQAVAKTKGGCSPEMGDVVLLRRRRASADPEHPANSLIGKIAILTCKGNSNGLPPICSRRILDVVVDFDNGVTSLLIGNDALMTTVRRYEAKDFEKLSTDDKITLVLDSPTGDLVTKTEMSTRSALRYIAQWKEFERLQKLEKEQNDLRRVEMQAAQRRAEERKRQVAKYNELMRIRDAEESRLHLQASRDSISLKIQPRTAARSRTRNAFADFLRIVKQAAPYVIVGGAILISASRSDSYPVSQISPPCPRCDGSGRVSVQAPSASGMRLNSRATCPDCRGQGSL